MTIIMSKVLLFRIKIENKPCKTGKNLLAAKSVIITLGPNIGIGDRAHGSEFLRYDKNNIQ